LVADPGGDRSNSGDRNSEFQRIRSWIIFLLIILVGVNLGVFLTYVSSNPSLSISAQIFGYLQSSAFTVITASILLPILMFFLESLFKIGRAVDQRIESQKQALVKDQLKAIGETSKMWNKLYELSGEVVHCTVEKGAEKRIEDILSRLGNLANEAEDVVNMWHFIFPDLETYKADAIENYRLTAASELFLYFINLLLHCAETVGVSICDGYTSKDRMDRIADLQASLEQIRDGIKSILHHSMLSIFRLSVETGRYSSAPALTNLGALPTVDKAAMSRTSSPEPQSELKSSLNNLQKWAHFIEDNEMNLNKVLPLATGTEVEVFRELWAKFLRWRFAKPKADPKEFPEYTALTKSFDGIPNREMLIGKKVDCSEDWIISLGRLLINNQLFD
jgi:hypothetical protein